MNPPGMAPPGGGCLRRISTIRSSTSMITSTVGTGGAGFMRDLPIYAIKLYMNFTNPAAIFVSSFIIALSGAGASNAAGPDTGNARNLWRPVADGIIASISNPYWSLWWATIGLGYLALSSGQGLTGVAFFFAGHILADEQEPGGVG